MFRTRLSLTALECRDNPSGPELIAPIESPPSTEPVATAPPPSNTTTIDIGAAVIGGATGTTGTTITDINSIYKVPLIPVGIN